MPSYHDILAQHEGTYFHTHAYAKIAKLSTVATKRGLRPNPFWKKLKAEDILQLLVVCYLESMYPDVRFNHSHNDLSSTPYGRYKMTFMGTQAGWPDIFVAKPLARNMGLSDSNREHYYGLYLELKTEDNGPYQKNGNLYADKHIQRQAAVHKQLRDAGYWANFTIGFDNTKKIIDWYLS